MLVVVLIRVAFTSGPLTFFACAGPISVELSLCAYARRHCPARCLRINRVSRDDMDLLV